MVDGAFVAAADTGEPVTAIRPIASHSGRRVQVGRGFDVNPVMWKVLRDNGIAVRGPEPGPARARPGTGEAAGLWRSWGERLLSRPASGKPFVPAHRAAISRVLGSPRLHHTVVTVEVISKEAAAEYALDVIDGAWELLLRPALARRSGKPVAAVRAAGEFTLAVVADAESREGSA